MSKKKLRGYGFSRRANGEFAPQRIQNMIIRQYCEGKDYEFLLSAFEYYMDGCYMMLKSLLDNIEEVDGVAFYSLNFMPVDVEERRRIYSSIIGANKELHFALENLVVKNEQDINMIEEVISCRQLSQLADIK